MKGFPAVKILMTHRISVVHPYDLALALNFEGDLIVRKRRYSALRAEYLNRDMMSNGITCNFSLYCSIATPKMRASMR